MPNDRKDDSGVRIDLVAAGFAVVLIALVWVVVFLVGAPEIIAAGCATLLIAGMGGWIVHLDARQRGSAAALRRREAQLLEAEELAQMVSLEWVVDGDRVLWSRAPEFLLGPRPEDGYPVFREMVHPDDRPRWLLERQRALDVGEPSRYTDYRLVRTDGALRWISCSQRMETDPATGGKRQLLILLDVTERKLAEAALAERESQLVELTQGLEREVEERTTELRKREELLHTVTENIPVMIGYLDRDRRVLFANSNFAGGMGFARTMDVVGRRIDEFLPPARLELHRPHIEAVLRGEAQGYKYPMLVDPSRRVEMNMVPDRRADGGVRGFFALVVEVTERDKAEQELRALVATLTATLEATADGILVVGVNRELVRYNQRFVDMWRIPGDVMASRGDGRRAPRFVLDQLVDPDGFVARIERIYAEPEHESFDTLHLKDGRVFERHSCPQRLAGNAAGRVWSFRDVTERVRAEASLRASDERYRTVVTNMSEGVVVRDAQGLIIDCNQSAERLLGIPLARMRERRNPFTGWQVLNEQGVAIAQKEIPAMTVLRTGRPITDAVTGFRRPDGSELWLSATSNPIVDPAGGAVTGVFTTFIDITARRHAEEARDRLEAQLRESQKMEALGTLAGGIAHDFNNLIAAILGNVALARHDVGSGHAALISLDEIGKAGERGKHLIEQILAFGRRQPQNLVQQPLRRVIEETVGLLRATLPAGVRIEFESDADAVQVRADATQVGQVVMNLCTNAWHAMGSDGGGVIRLRLDPVTLDEPAAHRYALGAPGDYLRLSVSDTGTGMDAETQARIFEPFFTTKPFGEGTGLGLAVVHGIVQAHRGGIAVTSQLGRGTTIEIVLPVAQERRTAERLPPARPEGTFTARRHVLIVDDEPAMLFLVTRMLKRLGYEVSPFEIAERAVEAVRADPAAFDIVVSDFNMPGMSGLDVARALHEIRPELPVVIASGYITDALREGATRTGVRHLIYKPNTVEELSRAIAEILESSVAGTPPSPQRMP